MNLIRAQIEELVSFLEAHKALMNCHMIDYFTKNLFEDCLKKELRQDIIKRGFENSLDILLKNEQINSPLGGMMRKARSFILHQKKDICWERDRFCDKLRESGCGDLSGIKLEVFVTPKKSHEVEVMSSVAAGVHAIAGTSHLIDVGDGKGYLSSLLALQHNIPILGVDSCEKNTDGAVKRVKKLEKVWTGLMKSPKKSVPSVPSSKTSSTFNDSSNYKQITQFVSSSTDFQKLISDIFLVETNCIGIVGLHTCGNLGPVCIKAFNNSKHIKTLCNVSCCYHLLEEDNESNFPMSDVLKARDYKLGRIARMLSSQSIERIISKSELPNKNLFYRALLEVFLRRNRLEGFKVGKSKTELASFGDYVKRALGKSEEKVITAEKELMDLFEEYKHFEKELNVFYLLRCLLAPAIESLILLDRLLYLKEQGHDESFLVQLFDPVTSPRCYALIAFK